MSSPSQPSGRSSYGATLRLRVRVERLRRDDVARQHHVEVNGFDVPDVLGHLAADQHAVCARAEVLEHRDLVLDLRAAGDDHERPLDLAEEAAEMLELGEQEQAGVCRE